MSVPATMSRISLQGAGTARRLRGESLTTVRRRSKGKVERMVGYVKEDFFARDRASERLAHLAISSRLGRSTKSINGGTT